MGCNKHWWNSTAHKWEISLVMSAKRLRSKSSGHCPSSSWSKSFYSLVAGLWFKGTKIRNELRMCVCVCTYWPTTCRNVKYSCGFSASVPGQLRHSADCLTAVSWCVKENPEKDIFSPKWRQFCLVWVSWTLIAACVIGDGLQRICETNLALPLILPTDYTRRLNLNSLKSSIVFRSRAHSKFVQFIKTGQATSWHWPLLDECDWFRTERDTFLRPTQNLNTVTPQEVVWTSTIKINSMYS